MWCIRRGIGGGSRGDGADGWRSMKSTNRSACHAGPEEIADLEVRATFLGGSAGLPERLLTRPWPWHASKHVRPG